MARVCVFCIWHYMQLSLHKPVPPIGPIYHTTNPYILSLMLFFHGHSRYRCNFGPEDKSSIVPHDMQALLKSTQKKTSRRCCRKKNEGRKSYWNTSLSLWPNQPVQRQLHTKKILPKTTNTLLLHHKSSQRLHCWCPPMPMANKWRFIVEKQTFLQETHIASSFTKVIYDTCLKNLSKSKSPGPDGIPNNILKALPNNFHDMMYLFFIKIFH